MKSSRWIFIELKKLKWIKIVFELQLNHTCFRLFLIHTTNSWCPPWGGSDPPWPWPFQPYTKSSDMARPLWRKSYWWVGVGCKMNLTFVCLWQPETITYPLFPKFPQGYLKGHPKFHAVPCSSMSLHAVPQACMQFHDLACSFKSSMFPSLSSSQDLCSACLNIIYFLSNYENIHKYVISE